MGKELIVSVSQSLSHIVLRDISELCMGTVKKLEGYSSTNVFTLK